ncbi:MAG: methyltransferase domain-containing protein [Micrococcales bacterium]|nr:methyltransferase domain-containing protein [Micrococcales bacterium]
MRCHELDLGVCRSCTWMGREHSVQVAAKHAAAVAALPDLPADGWAPPFAGAQQGYRNRAKLVVGGSVERPTLGILDADQRGVDLTGCGLYEPALAASFEVLAAFVTRAALEPYDVPARRGELKYLLVTVSPDAELMVRFVLRSTEALARIRKHLPWLRAALPSLVVASVNLQPAHAALLEGDREIVLTPDDALTMRVGDVALRLPPRSFFQTNTEVAGALYRQAAAWADQVAPASVLDLYCGVGGFALHLAAPGRQVTGVEVSAPAVAAAVQAAGGRPDVTFHTADALELVRTIERVPDLVVVNPPRRGLGPDLVGWLRTCGVQHLLYSSCHLPSLVADLAAIPNLRPVQAQVLDMFPQTPHAEVLVLLSRT